MPLARNGTDRDLPLTSVGGFSLYRLKRPAFFKIAYTIAIVRFRKSGALLPKETKKNKSPVIRTKKEPHPVQV